MRVCGIDPGQKGALCVLDQKDPTYSAYLDLMKSSLYATANWMFHQKIDQIWIENVHSIFGMSAKSNFTFGKEVGYVHAISSIILKGNEDQIHLVTPKVWQKAVGVTVSGSTNIKKQVSELSTALYPDVPVYGPKGGLRDGRSDAVMIAHYGLHLA